MQSRGLFAGAPTSGAFAQDPLHGAACCAHGACAYMDSKQAGPPVRTVPFGEALKVWTRVALLSFGGPAGQIAVMHRIIVEEKRWISEDRFLYALNYCMLLPGP